MLITENISHYFVHWYTKSNDPNMNRCKYINYIKLRNAKYYWIIEIPDMSHTDEIVYIFYIWIYWGDFVHYLIKENIYKLVFC